MEEFAYEVDHDEEFVSVPYGTSRSSVMANKYIKSLYDKGYSIQYKLDL